MTDRVKGLTIVLDRDYRTDDVEAIVNAIMMVKGVAKVEKSIVQTEDYFARARVMTRVQPLLYKAIQDIFDEKKTNLT